MWKLARYSLLLMGLSLAACENGTGPAVGSETQVWLVPSTAPSAVQIPASGLTIESTGPGDGTGPIHEVIPLDAVASIDVTLTGVQLKPWHGGQGMGGSGTHEPGGPAGAANGWTSIDVPEGTVIDLMNLPADGLPVAAGTLEPGTYGHLRLLFSGAEITLSRDVTLPDGTTLAAGTYPLQIGGADADWLLLQTAQITVADGASDVVIEFDRDASVRAIAVLDDGTLVMPPVLRAWGQPHGAGNGRGPGRG